MKALFLLSSCFSLFLLTSCAEFAQMVKDYNRDQLHKAVQELRDEELLQTSLAYDGIPENHIQ